jgi:hypothetical protein
MGTMDNHRTIPPARIAPPRTATLFASAALAAAAAAHPDAPPPAWRWVRTVHPERAVPGTIGPAIAACSGTIVTGPCRDADIGDGMPTLLLHAIRAGFGLPSDSTATESHPMGDRGAGFATALAAADRTVVAGSPFAGCRRAGCSSGQAHLVYLAHDGTRSIDEIACPEPQPASEFGAAVATDGLTVAVGSPRHDGATWDTGAVDIYELERTDLGPVPVHVARLLPPAPAASARFGAAIAIDGDWMAIGEPGAGTSLPRDGDVHVARRIAGRWQLTCSLRTSAGVNGWLGASVTLAGGQLAAGAPIARHPDTARRTGAVARWALEGNAWNRIPPVHAPDLAEGSGFGLAVALGEGFLAVGAPGDDAGGEDAGSAWVMPWSGGALLRLQARSPGAGAGFGAGLAFGTGRGRTPVGPTRFLAVSGRTDPEQPPVPGSVELFGYRPPDPLLVAHPASPQSRSASAIAIAADASVTRAGRQPDSSARDSASGP